jgi:hypothetical protein
MAERIFFADLRLKLKTAGLLAGLVIVVLVATAAWLYFLARLARDLAIWIVS